MSGSRNDGELLGVMTHEKVKRGIFITTAAYTRDATSFGADNPIQTLDGVAFLPYYGKLSADQQKALREFAFDGDYKTPTCPSCGMKMKRRRGKKGAFFWVWEFSALSADVCVFRFLFGYLLFRATVYRARPLIAIPIW